MKYLSPKQLRSTKPDSLLLSTTLVSLCVMTLPSFCGMILPMSTSPARTNVFSGTKPSAPSLA